MRPGRAWTQDDAAKLAVDLRARRLIPLLDEKRWMEANFISEITKEQIKKNGGYQVSVVVPVLQEIGRADLVVRANTRFEKGGATSEVFWTPEWAAVFAVSITRAGSTPHPVAPRHFGAVFDLVEASEELQASLLSLFALGASTDNMRAWLLGVGA